MPQQTFTGSATTDASVAGVWSALNRPATWERISGVDDVFDEVLSGSGQLVGFKFHSTAVGKQYVGVAKPGTRVEGESLTWDIATSEISGQITVELASVDAGTRIDVLMTVQSVSMMASFGFPVIAAVIGNGFQETVNAFASQFDTA